jgi:hypothetical protein
LMLAELSLSGLALLSQLPSFGLAFRQYIVSCAANRLCSPSRLRLFATHSPTAARRRHLPAILWHSDIPSASSNVTLHLIRDFQDNLAQLRRRAASEHHRAPPSLSKAPYSLTQGTLQPLLDGDCRHVPRVHRVVCGSQSDALSPASEPDLQRLHPFPAFRRIEMRVQAGHPICPSLSRSWPKCFSINWISE